MIVEEKPRVSLSVEPTVSVAFKKNSNGAKGVSELLNANVTLSCIPADLNGGDRFLAVRWFLDGELLRAVSLAQKCIANITGSDELESSVQDSEIEVLEDCKTDPTKIVLLNVRRLFGGNYSCQGRVSGADGVGWGAESAPTELKVLYPPRGARLRHRPDIVKKGAAFQVRKENSIIQM